MRRLGLPFVAALAALAVLAGCSDGGGDGGTTSTTRATVDDRLVLRKVAIKKDDVPAGLQITVIEGGDQVDTAPTLDMCGFDFPSEAARMERLQTEAVDAAGAPLLGNESVVYRSAADAEGAMAEMRKAVAECPPGELRPAPLEELPALRYDLKATAEEQLTDLAGDRLAFTAVITDEQGQSETYGIVYQRRGRVLAALYGPAVPTVLPYAGVVADRLASLSPQEAGD